MYRGLELGPSNFPEDSPCKTLLAVIMQRFDGYAVLDGGFA